MLEDKFMYAELEGTLLVGRPANTGCTIVSKLMNTANVGNNFFIHSLSIRCYYKQ
ncbi:hypothetical protein SBF1_8900002 [Candidatus Desulfosporosinus infrequens]|uniref:Uncharacterized protein n=1 Tax=Candidatus Desulfosporosinus infrequens TaxID=2043169 RepID=A0A2U3LW56_9FIRM|nr:hypothetical protein SBF1_8900002 [Candidatus Desulfosporosinus infrequens]